MTDPTATARVLIEALPYIQRFAGQTVVVKYGGNALSGTEYADPLDVFAQDIVMLRAVGIRPVVVHGGGPQINAMLDRLGVKSEFRDGRRVTDEATMQVVRMVLTGEVNPSIVSAISSRGGRAVGLSGADDGMVSVVQRDPALGFVGDVTGVRTAVLEQLLDDGCIPVIATIGVDASGQTFNINADVVAGKIAEVLKAEKLVMMTNTVGVLDKNGNLLTGLTARQIDALFEDGTLSGGMLPKISSALDAAKAGVHSVHIIDGRVDHALLLEIMTDQGVGTMIRSH